MGDVITLVVNMNKKGFEKGCTELRGAINSLSGTAKKMADGMKSVIPSIIGVGSAFGILTKAASTFMSQNVALTRQMEAVWTALGNLIGPIVEQLVSWVVTAVSYLISFLNLLGITSKTASELSKKAQSATSNLQKTIAGFDELNVLQDNQEATLPNLDPKEWMSELTDLLKAGQFAEAGRYLAAKLNEMIENIDWVGIGQKLAYCFKGAIDFLGNFIRDFDAHRLGELVATMINQILNIDTSSEDTWRNLGEILVAKFTLVFDFLTGFLEELDTTALAEAVSGIIIGALEALTDSIATADWKKIGENIGNFFENIDWEGIAKAIWEAFTTALAGASDLWDGLPDWLQDIALGVAAIKTASAGITFFSGLAGSLQAIMNLDAVGFFGKLGEVIAIVASGAGTLREALEFVFGTIGTTIAGIASVVGGAVLAVVNFFDMLKEGFSWLNQILMVIGIALAAVGAVILGAPALIAAVVAAIVAAVLTAIVVIKDNWAAICQWFSETCAAIVQFFSDLWAQVAEFAQSAWTKISDIASSCVEGLKSGWENFVSFILGVWNEIVTGADTAVKAIGRFFTSVKAGFDKVGEILTGIGTSIASAANMILEMLGSAITVIVSAVGTAIGKVKDGWAEAQTWFEDLFSRLGQFFSDLWSNMVDVVQVAWSNIVSIATGCVSAISSMIESAATVIRECWQSVTSWFGEICSEIGQFFSDLWTKVALFAQTAWNNMVSFATVCVAAIVALVGPAITAIKNGWTSIQKWFVDSCTAIGQFFSELWSNVVAFAQNAWGNIGTIASNCINGLKSGWQNFQTFMLNLWNGIVSGVKGAINSIIGCVNGMISAVVAGVNAVSNTLNRIRIDIPSWVPGIGGGTLGFNLPTFSAPQIPYLEKGGVLKKGQVGILEGKGGEAVVPLERNTEWINKMADAFMSRVQAGNYDLTGNAKTLAALNAIADRVSYRTPAVATGTVLPYGVDTPNGSGGVPNDDSDLPALFAELAEKLDQILYLMEHLQFVADFGDNIRALARRITKEQKRDKISEGR